MPADTLERVADPIDRAIRTLNELLELDPDAISILVGHRIPTNDKLAAHATVQCGTSAHGGRTVGMLGVINALFGVRTDGAGHIAVEEDDGQRVVRFIRRARG
jgi:hypothetical protein